MKTILIILALACIFYSANAACGAGDCNSCADKDACDAVVSGCEYDLENNRCDNTPSTNVGCSIFNNKPTACEADSSNCGHYNYNTNTCLAAAPTKEDGCADLNGFQTECDGDAACTYKTDDKTCVTPPSYVADCGVLSNHPAACTTESDCTTNTYDDSCVANASAAYTNDDPCSSLNGFQTACDAVSAGSGQGDYELGCEFDAATNMCSPTRGAHTSACGDYAKDKEMCNANSSDGLGTGCTYNVNTNTCVDTPAFSACVEFNNMPDACEKDTNCKLKSDNTCATNGSVVYSGGCSSLNGFQADCDAKDDEGSATFGCTYNTSDNNCEDTLAKVSDCDEFNNLPNACIDESTCTLNASDDTCVANGSVPAYSSACSDLNGFQTACEAESANLCTYDTNSNTCSETPSCTNNTDCAQCNGFMTECETASGCSYNVNDDTCVAFALTFVACTSYNGFADSCEGDSDCGKYNYNSNVCGNTAPTFNTNCASLNGFQTECDASTQGENTVADCAYKSDDHTCTTKPSYSDNCNVFQHYASACAAESDCTYNADTGACTAAPDNCDGVTSSNCSPCDVQATCDGISGCSWNSNSDGSCTATPSYSDNCNVYQHYAQACADESDCSYTADTGACAAASADNCTGVTSANCSPCDVQATCDGITGCSWNSSSDGSCTATPTYNNCTEFDNYEEACGEEDGCAYDTGDCTAEPTCSTATSENCDLCDDDSDACQAISGCSFNLVDDECTATPSYDTNCASLSGYPIECVADSNCAAYNVNTNACETSAPSVEDGSVTCATLNYYEDACDAVGALAGNGANALGCAFNMSNNMCVDVPAFDAASDDCADLNNLEKVCTGQTDECVFDMESGVCRENVACSAADNDDDTCYACDDDMSGCNSANDCAYDEEDMECVTAPTYSDNCSVLSGFSALCAAQSAACTYNEDEKECIANASVPTYNDDCTDLNGFKDACENEEECGTYNDTTFVCSKTTKKEASSSATHLQVSFILAVVLALLF